MNSTENKLVIYQAENGAIELRGDSSAETIWASQKQMAEVFGVDVRTINDHIQNIFSSEELNEDPTIRKFRIVQVEGDREVTRDVSHYNLDMIISVGYRVNSKTATSFRKWATQTLKQHITQGYTINEKLLKQRESQYLQAIADIKKIAGQGEMLDTDHVLDIIATFSRTWFSLQSYDQENVPNKGVTQKDLDLDVDTLYADIAKLKKDLTARGEATELFAQEKTDQALAGIVGNIMQSAFGKDAYPTLEEKAAHLLYFVVKNHVFNDGNKRTGAFCFVWFLRQAGIDFGHAITPEALTALTLLVAQSDPKDKERVVGLILLMFRE